jgi:hypothetical protein
MTQDRHARKRRTATVRVLIKINTPKIIYSFLFERRSFHNFSIFQITRKMFLLSKRIRKPKYETVLWTLHVTITVLAIIDRFTTNFWPRQTFRIGSGSAGNDRMPIKEGPWSVALYDILARVSGRFSIVCFNFMLITR